VTFARRAVLVGAGAAGLWLASSVLLVGSSGIAPPWDAPLPTASPLVDAGSSARDTQIPTGPGQTWPPLAAGSVPILYYHRIEAPPDDFAKWPRQRRDRFLAYDVLPTAFEAQLDWLAGHGYTTILPRDLAAHWDRREPLPLRPVVLTFDDGFHDWTTTVLPLLRAHHMVAEFYLTIDAIRAGTITWHEVRALAAAGNGIGAHDVHHVQLAGFPNGERSAPLRVMRAEVRGARHLIAEHVGRVPDSMAYVGGGFDARLQSIVRRAGYTTARSIIPGIHQSRAKRFALRVIRVGAHEDVIDVVSGALRPGLPVFARRIGGAT
jgi:peptidoglycan/xylan/chitin deacetylase (PgdA/CDA1 family)